jgi:predicted transcriptional regulator
MKEQINEFDMTKKMMQMIRGGYKKVLTEAVDQTTSEDNDTISPSKGDAIFNDEYKKLSEMIDPSVEITNFKIYPIDKNAIIEGTMLNGRVTYRMELREDEVLIDTSSIGLNDTNNETLRKLQGFFKNWKDEWSKKITTEFK